MARCSGTASARATWNIKPSGESAETDCITLGAFCRKYNLGKRPAPVGIQATFDADRVTLHNTDLGAVDDLAAGLPLWRRIASVLKAGPQTLASIASELGHDNTESLDPIVRRHKQLFTKVPGTDGIMRVALLDRRAA